MSRMPFSAHALEKPFTLVYKTVVKTEQIECDLALSVLLLTTIRVFTVVKLCCGIMGLRLARPQLNLTAMYSFNCCK